MNSDLISRSALLKAMEEERQYLLARGQTGAEHILVHHCLPIIDNAPAVADRTEEVLSLQNTIAKLVEGIAENGRQQGEWKPFNSYYRKCDKCERLVGFDYADPEHGNWFNFCPNCGAKMQIGGAE